MILMIYYRINGHKDITVISLMIIIAVLFSSCGHAHISSGDKIYESSQSNVHWLSFSLSDHEKERDMVREKYAAIVAEAEDFAGHALEPKYYLSLYDFNGNGHDEIIALIDLGTTYLTGTHASGYLTIFTTDASSKKIISEKGLAGFSLDNAALEFTEQIGVMELDKNVSGEPDWIFEAGKVIIFSTPSGCISQPEPYAQAMEAYRQILRNEAAFIEVLQNEHFINGEEQEEHYYLDEYFSKSYDDTLITNTDLDFFLADMDGDAIPEVVLGYGSKVFWVFLHYENDAVYCSTFSDRQMDPLKTDGTFEWADGISNYGFGRLEFTGKRYEIARIAEYDDTDYPDPAKYYIDGESVSEEAFLTFQDAQRAKEDVVWYALTEENIEMYVK